MAENGKEILTLIAKLGVVTTKKAEHFGDGISV